MVSGAGVLILELYKGHPVITLFGINQSNYSDPGGHIDPGERPEECAYRECREESENLINIKSYELLQYAVPYRIKQYQVYIMYVQNLSRKDYYRNVKKIFTSCRPRHWKETNCMTRFLLSDIITAAQNNLTYCRDIYGGQPTIRNRTMGIIRAASGVLSNLTMSTPIQLYKHNVIQSRMPCLIGTVTYIMQTHSDKLKGGCTQYDCRI